MAASNIPLAGLVPHTSGGLSMGLSYKKLVHEHTRMPLGILGRVAIVLVYCYSFAGPGFVIGQEISIRPSLLTGTEKGRL